MSESTLETALLDVHMSLPEQIIFLKAILKNLTSYSIIATDIKGVIIAWSDAAKLQFGYISPEIMGKKLFVLQATNTAKNSKIEENFEEFRQTGVWSCIHKNGHRFIAFVNIFPNLDNNERLIGYTIFSSNIDKSEKIFNELQEAEKLLHERDKDLQDLEKIRDQAASASLLKSEFLANVSHELRTPLNAILGFAELMYLGKVGAISLEHKEYLQEILSNSRQLLLLINDLLDLTKIESGKTEFYHELINIKEMIKETKEIFSAIILKNKLELKVEVSSVMGKIIIDPTKLKQVIYNYVSNAIKFSPIGGCVTIRAHRDKNNTFKIEVENAGIGIAKKDFDLLFVPFQQLDASYRKKFQGTGLGLSLTKKIVEAQGGTVGVSSVLGKGSKFYARLPCFPLNYQNTLPLKKNIKSPADVIISDKANAIPKILVVEEVSEERDNLVDTLEKTGYIVETAISMAEALKYKLGPFDTILLDLFLPDLKSWNILRSLRTKNSLQKSPTLVITVLAKQAKGIGFKIHDFLIKPVLSKDLLAAFKWAGAGPHLNKTVLIFDDDEKSLKFATRLLNKSGYKVIGKKNVKSALVAIKKQHPDVLLLDPYMAKLEGFELLHRFRKSQKGLYTPVVIWTIKNLTEEERSHLRTQLQQHLILKEGKITDNVINELNTLHPVLNLSK